MVCSGNLSFRSRTSGPCHVQAGFIISSILAVVGAAQTGGDCSGSIPALANAGWLVLADWSRLVPPAMATANNACVIWFLSFLGSSVVAPPSLIGYRLICIGSLLSRGLWFSSIRRMNSRFANSRASARDMPCELCIDWIQLIASVLALVPGVSTSPSESELSGHSLSGIRNDPWSN